MTNTKSYRAKSLLIAFLAVALVLSIFPVSVFAVTDQDTPSFSVSVSNENPKAGELVTVTVQIDNCNSIRYYIGALQLQLNYDSALFTLQENSSVKSDKFSDDDVAELGHDPDESAVRFGYVMAGSSKGMSRQTTELFSVSFRVRDNVSENGVSAEFTLSDVKVYSSEESYRELPCRITNKTVTVWEVRPPILLNNSATNRGKYESAVTVTFDAPSAKLIYNGTEYQITSGYQAEMNGSYTITVETGSGPYSVTFTIARTIRRISVKTGTLATSYPLGVTPSYSNGILLIEYTDGTYSEISLTAPGVSVTGFDPQQIGSQQLTITYEGFITNVTVTVQNKTVQNIELKTPYPKTTYLEGSTFDVTGGVIQVTYQDYTMEDVPLSLEMISGFDPALVGTQTIKITYGTAEITLNVEVVSRAAVDDLIAKIAEIDLRTLDPDSAEDRERIRTLVEAYNSMSAVEQAGVVNYSTLRQAYEIIQGGETKGPGETTDNSGGQQGGDQQQEKNGNKVWLIVLIVIAVLSVAGGAAYFIIVYLKKKREDEEYYYDDDEDEDDENEFLDDDEYEDEEEYDDDEE